MLQVVHAISSKWIHTGDVEKILEMRLGHDIYIIMIYISMTRGKCRGGRKRIPERNMKLDGIALALSFMPVL